MYYSLGHLDVRTSMEPITKEPRTRSDNSKQRINWVFRASAPEHWNTFMLDDEKHEFVDRLLGILFEFCSSFAFQLESAPSTGYLHFQGALQCTNKRSFIFIQKQYKFEFLAPMRGTVQQAFGYAQKQDTRIEGPWLFGNPCDMNKPNSFAEYVKAVTSGMSNKELWAQHPNARARYPGVLVDYRASFKPKRTQDLEVYVLFGGAGTGKTRAVQAMYPDAYVVPYSRQGIWLTHLAIDADVVVLEDFDGNLPLKQFNRLVDRYAEQVEVKHGHVWWLPNIIFLTSNTPPQAWYPEDGRQDTKKQIFRRINWCFDFNTPEGVKMEAAVSVEDLSLKYPIESQLKSGLHSKNYAPFVQAKDNSYRNKKLQLLTKQLEFFKQFTPRIPEMQKMKPTPVVEDMDLWESLDEFDIDNGYPETKTNTTFILKD